MTMTMMVTVMEMGMKARDGTRFSLNFATEWLDRRLFSEQRYGSCSELLSFDYSTLISVLLALKERIHKRHNLTWRY